MHVEMEQKDEQGKYCGDGIVFQVYFLKESKKIQVILDINIENPYSYSEQSLPHPNEDFYKTKIRFSILEPTQLTTHLKFLQYLSSATFNSVEDALIDTLVTGKNISNKKHLPEFSSHIQGLKQMLTLRQ